MVVSIIIKSLYFFLPVYFANMAPVLFKWLPFKKPISKKVFGRNKTWRGIIVAILTGGIVFWIQKIMFNAGFVSLAVIDYHDFPVYYGFLLGTGAILGDLVKSYYKRKVGIKPGDSWLFFDQEDFVIGAILFSFFYYVPPIEIIFTVFLISPILHIVTNFIGYHLKIREKPL